MINENNVHETDYRPNSLSISNELKEASGIIKSIRQLEQAKALDGWYFLPIGNNVCFTASSRFLSENYDDLTLERYSYTSIHKLSEQLPSVTEELQEFLSLHEKPFFIITQGELDELEKNDVLTNKSVYLNVTPENVLTFYFENEGCITAHIYQTEQPFYLFDHVTLSSICFLNKYKTRTGGLPIYSSADSLMAEARQALTKLPMITAKFDVSRHLEVMLYKIKHLISVLSSILSKRVVNLSHVQTLLPYLQTSTHQQLSPQNILNIGDIISGPSASIHDAIKLVAEVSEGAGGNRHYFYVWLPNNRSLVVTLMKIDDEKECARYVSNPNFLIEQAITPSTYSSQLHINANYDLAFCEYIDRDNQDDWAKTIKSPFDLYKHFISPYLKLIRDLHTRGLTHGDITDKNIALSSRFKKAIFIDLKHLFEITKDDNAPIDHRRMEIEDLHDMCESIESNAPPGFQNDHVLKMIREMCQFIDRWGDNDACDNVLCRKKVKNHESTVQAMYGLDTEDPELELFARNHGFNITKFIQYLCEKKELFKQAYLEYVHENSPNRINLYVREIYPSTFISQNPNHLYNSNSSSNPRVNKRDADSALQEEHLAKK